METKELYYPQISAQAGSYTFEEGVELEIYSSKSSYFDWAKIRFTSQFRPKLSLKKKDPATIQLGYWYEYKLTVIDRFGNPDANYPALPGIKSKKQFKAGAVVAVALPYGDLTPAIIGEVEL